MQRHLAVTNFWTCAQVVYKNKMANATDSVSIFAEGTFEEQVPKTYEQSLNFTDLFRVRSSNCSRISLEIDPTKSALHSLPPSKMLSNQGKAGSLLKRMRPGGS